MKLDLRKNIIITFIIIIHEMQYMSDSQETLRVMKEKLAGKRKREGFDQDAELIQLCKEIIPIKVHKLEINSLPRDHLLTLDSDDFLQYLSENLPSMGLLMSAFEPFGEYRMFQIDGQCMNLCKL
jgi:hypothetical protein